MNIAAAPNKFLQTLRGVPQDVPPIWLMRQAGRYLPEYLEIRAMAQNFLDFCYTPRLATEATLQPIRRFGFDAAIVFSDILVVPDSLGQKVSFESGEGPRLRPITTHADFGALRERLDLGRLEPVFETINRARTNLPADIALIGFCGAPWTVASYMIAGQGTADQAPARLFAYRHRALFQQLIALLVESSADYLIRQLRAGVQAVQIFDSCAGSLPLAEFERWCLEPVRAIVDKVRAAEPNAAIIAFPRGAGASLAEFAPIEGLAAIGLDTTVDPGWAVANLPANRALQGNLDPIALLAGGEGLDESVERILASFYGRAHIFNLGHGVLPETPIGNVERLIKRVRGEP
jgi:uroporphyrinogen decarboxylase